MDVENAQINTNENEQEADILDNLNFYHDKFKLNSKLKYVYPLLLIPLLFNVVFFGNVSFFFLISVLLYFMVYAIYTRVGLITPSKFKKIVNDCEDIFSQEISPSPFLAFKNQIHEKINKNQKRLYRKKYSFLIYLILISSSLGLYINIITDKKTIEEILFLVFIFISTSLAILIFYFIIFSISLMLINFIGAFNQLGTKDYPLEFSCETLERENIYDIGKFCAELIIYLMIIVIFGDFLLIFSDFDQLILFFYYIFNIFIISFFLYFGFYHPIIKNYKKYKKLELIKKIQEIELKPDSEMDVFQKYKTIEAIHDYHGKIDNIRSYPFYSSSIIQLLLTLIVNMIIVILNSIIQPIFLFL